MSCASTNTTSQILATARQLELEVSELKNRADDLRNEQERWAEHNKNGIPRREMAAIDHVHDKTLEANEQEKKARESERRASTEKRALENASRACAERVKLAENSAKRAEEKLAVEEKSFRQWQGQADREKAGSQARREKILKEARAHLAVVQREAGQRRVEGDEDVARETARVDVAVQQVRTKLAKQRVMLESRGRDRHARAEARLRSAEVEAQTAEAKKDREVSMAALRAERSRCAASSKVRLSSLDQDKIATKALLRLDQAKNESVLRLEAAKLREVAAIEARERLEHSAQAKVERLEKERAKVLADCAEVEREYDLMVDRLRRELTIKAENWEAMVRDVEAVSMQKVADVQDVATQLKAALLEETQVSKVHLDSEVVNLQERLASHDELVQRFLKKKHEHTAKVLKLAGIRVEDAGARAKLQVAEAELRAASTVDLVQKELEMTKGLANSRVQKAVDHLMSYLETNEKSRPQSAAGLAMELWIPLPGTPSDLILPGMPE